VVVFGQVLNSTMLDEKNWPGDRPQ
jgi:hypothetical protein